MKAQIMKEFENTCREYLSTLDIGRLRNYGRSIGVDNPTKRNKNLLIEMIIDILTGKASSVLRNGRGAPVKNSYVDPSIKEELERHYQAIVNRYQETTPAITEADIKFPEVKDVDIKTELDAFRLQGKTVIRVEDGAHKSSTLKEMHDRPIYIGQLQVVGTTPILMTLDCKQESERIIFPIEKIREYDLRDGDVLSCYVGRNQNTFMVTEVLMINGLTTNSFERNNFEESEACYPYKKIAFYNGEPQNVTAKYLEWLLPIYRGQRGSIIASPKVGKSSILLDIIKSVSKISQNLTLLVLLTDQSPENVSRFRGVVEKENLLYTTYEDDAERQVFVADFALKRAKRLAESGKDVLLLVDSLTSLAKAFNETASSIGGKTLAYGLESKTLHYIKKYFGTARCLNKSGSITMIGAISVNTGNPIDDILATELSNVSNLEICLSDDLAFKRIYPTIDFSKSVVKESNGILQEEEIKLQAFLRMQYLSKHSVEDLHQTLSSSKEFTEFCESLK